MPVVISISLVISPSRSISLAVAIRVPSRTKMPGFSVPVTMSVDSPSRPMEVRPSTPCNFPCSSSQLSIVVFPAFLHMPTMDMVFTLCSCRKSCSFILPLLRSVVIQLIIIADKLSKRNPQFFSYDSLRPAFIRPPCVRMNTLSAQRIFCHVHATAKNDSTCSSPMGGEFCEAFYTFTKNPTVYPFCFLSVG